MTQPKAEALIALEATVAAGIRHRWDKVARKAQKAAIDAVRAGKFHEAYDAIESMSLKGVVTDGSRQLEEVFVSSMMFGASRLVPLQSIAMMNGHPVPDILGGPLTQLTQMVETEFGETLRKAGLKVLNDAEAELKKEDIVKDEVSDLADALNKAVLGQGRGLIDVGANLTTSRLVSFGFLDQARQIEVTTYQISEELDTRICPVCETMHGKTFEVIREFYRVQTILQILDPNELKTAAPWPKQDKDSVDTLRSMTEAELQGAGFGSPPYHPLCRGYMTKAGTVKQVIQIHTPQTQPVVEAALPPTGVRFDTYAEAKAYVEEHGVTSDAVNKYTSHDGFFQKVNRSLRNGSDEYMDFVEELREDFSVKDQSFVSYRGVETRIEHELGDVIVGQGFTSTSLSRDQAMGFAGLSRDSDVGYTVFEILSPSGARTLITNPPEAELLLDHGQEFRVVGVKENVDVPFAQKDGTTRTVRVLRYYELEVPPG